MSFGEVTRIAGGRHDAHRPWQIYVACLLMSYVVQRVRPGRGRGDAGRRKMDAVGKWWEKAEGEGCIEEPLLRRWVKKLATLKAVGVEVGHS